MVLWIIIFFIIILISSVLAYRSMKDYEEIPDSLSLNSLFYIKNPENFTPAILKKLHQLLGEQKQFFSIEKLFKGKEKALLIFGPRDLAKHLSDLNLVELEDYLTSEGEIFGTTDLEKKISANQSITWLIEPKNNPKRQIHTGSELKGLEVGEGQKVFIQTICMPQESPEVFQTTWRVMVADSDSIERVALAKRIERSFSSATGLNKHTDDFPEFKKFESFKQRSLVPKEVAHFPMTAQEIFDILVN